MTKSETAEFIEILEEIGDVWTEEQVLDVYGDYSLEDAISDRKTSINKIGDIIETVLNR